MTSRNLPSDTKLDQEPQLTDGKNSSEKMVMYPATEKQNLGGQRAVVVPQPTASHGENQGQQGQHAVCPAKSQGRGEMAAKYVNKSGARVFNPRSLTRNAHCFPK